MKMHFVAAVAATALMTAGAFASSTPAPTSSSAPAASSAAAAAGTMQQMSRDHFRVSKLMGVDVYGSDNEKIGDIDELIVDKQGKIHGIVVGVGGFLGIGQKDVAIPFDQVTWMTQQEAQAQAQANRGTAGGAAGQPATTGATGTAAGTSGASGGMAANNAAAANNNDSTPARAMVKMTKADLQNAPEFRYSDSNRAAAGSNAPVGNTNPPAPANRPANAPAQ